MVLDEGFDCIELGSKTECNRRKDTGGATKSTTPQLQLSGNKRKNPAGHYEKELETNTSCDTKNT